MSCKHIGKQSISFKSPPSVSGAANVVGKKESDGPLGKSFDCVSENSLFGEKTWEKAESAMQQRALELALKKAGLSEDLLDCVFAGDLLNQCTASSFALRGKNIPMFGIYGACSTMGEGLSLAAVSVDGGFADNAAVVVSSHFCTAERQFRTPLEYGGQRTPTAQWTVTGSGAVILSSAGNGPYITNVTTGRVVDRGITDINNMGAAMAPAAYDTLMAHFEDTGRSPSYYDLIATGDLGREGHEILLELFRQGGIENMTNLTDCGMLIYDREKQDVHSGGSGCGCSASVLSAYLLERMRHGEIKRLLFAPTGALLSQVSCQQGESIPGICHAVAFSAELTPEEH